MRLAALLCVLAACPPPARNGGNVAASGGATASASIDPGACGEIATNAAGHKVYAFLVASAELDRASVELDSSIHDACVQMANDLGVSSDGTTKNLCTRVASALQENLHVSVTTQKQFVTRYTPPECHTDVNLASSFAAECEGGAIAGGGVANASAECQASAEIHASTHTECSQPKVEVVQQDVTIVDATQFARATAAIGHGLPAILRAQKRLELAGQALAHWVSSGASLVSTGAELVQQLGDKALCVGGQLAGIADASGVIQTRIEVSVEVTASVSASAGASPN